MDSLTKPISKKKVFTVILKYLKISKKTDVIQILIVDDEKINRVLLSRILEKNGYKCLEASNGYDAIEKVKNTN